jgi:hypothetical protein
MTLYASRRIVFLCTLILCAGAAFAQASRSFAPYVDMSKMADRLDWFQAHTEVKQFTLAFVVSGDGCTATWLGGSPVQTDTLVASGISKIRARGSDVYIAFGGYDGLELAQTCKDVASLQSAYQTVVDKYKAKVLDLDIEHTAIEDPVSIDRRSQALTALSAANPGLQINYTLPATPAGLTDLSVNVLKSAVKFGTKVAVVNLMTMDYGKPVTMGAMGANATSAAGATMAQLKALGMDSHIGITPMIGVQDSEGETFTLDDAQVVVNYALANSDKISLLAFWSIGRDNGSCFGKVSPLCSGIPQKDWDFTRIFQKFVKKAGRQSPHRYDDLVGGVRGLGGNRYDCRLTVERHRFHTFLDSVRVLYHNVVGAPAPLSRNFELPPIGRDTRVDDETLESEPHPENPTRHCRVIPASTASKPGMPRSPVRGVVFAHDELAVGIRLSFAHLDLVILVIGQQGVVVLHRPAAAAQLAFGNHRPRVGMAEDRRILLDSLVDATHEANIVVRFGECRPQEMNAVVRVKVLVHRVHCRATTIERCSL